MQKIFMLCVCVLLTISGMSNNIKIDGEAKIVAITNDTATVEFNLSWDNSWRDDFNWDAAWIFLKYKKKGISELWHPAYLTQTGHEALPQAGNQGGNYTFMFGEIGTAATSKVTGLYLMREDISEGNVKTKVRIKWPIRSNSKLLLKASDFGASLDSINVAAYVIETVYVPNGSYYLGDDASTKRFEQKITSIPAADNQIGNLSYVYSASSVINTSYPVNAALPAVGGFWRGVTSGAEDWWQVDFGVKKRIRSFSVGAVYALVYGYLEGSNTGVEGDWRTLWSGGSACWTVSSTYPIAQRLTIEDPGDYRFYRIRMKSTTYCGIYNVAMSESDYGNSLVLIDSEAARTVGGVALPVRYPQGYSGYYMMKYEVSQEQYVEFLNSLTLNQQKSRVANNNFAAMKKGDYAFGELNQPSNRNGIAFLMYWGTKSPVSFGCNLNPANEFYSEDDGQTLACNYLSPADMLAYCDWSGLRPMSELEYEKACRRPYPQLPEKGEYAWNEKSGLQPIAGISDLTGAGSMREAPYDYRINVNSGAKLDGPLRNGAFATSVTTQANAGATYWGVMEMSGNLWETCYNAASAGAAFKSDDVNYSHGDGYIIDAGTDITATYWPTSIAAFAVRGGSYVTADSLLRTSDRTYATSNFFPALTTRKAEVGFRGVRSVMNSSGFTPGELACQNGLSSDTVCSGLYYTIIGSEPENIIGKTTYSWYLSEDNGKSWSILPGESGLNLKFEFVNIATTALKSRMFKRKAMCAVGELFSGTVSVATLPVPFDVLPLEIVDAGQEVVIETTWGKLPGQQWTIKEATGIGFSSAKISSEGVITGAGYAKGNLVVEVRISECSYAKTVNFIWDGVEIYDLAPGKYLIECWGGQGGRGTEQGVLKGSGGLGGYASGEIVLTEPLTLYALLGGAGGDARNNGYVGGLGGRHGGGEGGTDGGDNEASGGGGGASDVRLTLGDFNSRIMVAGGGGGAVWQGTSKSAGGGLTTTATQYVKGATQTSGYKFGEGGKGSTFKTPTGGGSIGGGGGGGGYYGGFGGPLLYGSTDAEYNKGFGSGGSGFISGHPGCNAVNVSGIHTGQPNHYSGLVFLNTKMQSGVRTGAGEVRITPIP